MEDLLRKFRRHTPYSYRDNDDHYHHSRSIKKLKKIIIIGVVVTIVVIALIVTLLIAAINWVFDRNSADVKQAASSVTEQVVPNTSLNLDSYISGNQVDVQKLTDTFNSLPAQVQNMWLADLKAQTEELQNQAGVASETITSLNKLYQTLQQTQ